MIGGNSAKIANISKQLDYSLEDTQDRLHLLYELLMDYDEDTEEYYPNEFLQTYFDKYYNPNIKQTQSQSHKLPVCYNLSYMAGYVLFNKQEKNTTIIREKTQKYRDTKHISLETTVEEQGEESVKPVETAYLRVKPTVTKEDQENIPELRGYADFIEELKEKLDNEDNPKEQYKLRQIIKGARQDQLALKLSIQRPISFTRLSPTSHKINYDEDTGYSTKNHGYTQVSYNHIQLSEPSHIAGLLKNYSSLRHASYDDTQSDIKYILDELDDLIEAAPLYEHFRFILIKRIDGLTYEELQYELQKEMGMKLSAGYISSIFLNRIPDVLSKYYIDSFEEWYYTFKQRGDYKTCTKQISPDCKKNYLRTEKYFRKDRKSPDGLSTICKVCRKLQDAQAAAKRRAKG